MGRWQRYKTNLKFPTILYLYFLSPEVLVPAQTDAQFEIDEYFQVHFLPQNKQNKNKQKAFKAMLSLFSRATFTSA